MKNVILPLIQSHKRLQRFALPLKGTKITTTSRGKPLKIEEPVLTESLLVQPKFRVRKIPTIKL